MECSSYPGSHSIGYSVCTHDQIKHVLENIRSDVLPRMEHQFDYEIPVRPNRDNDTLIFTLRNESDAKEAAGTLEETLPNGLISEQSGKTVKIYLQGDAE